MRGDRPSMFQGIDRLHRRAAAQLLGRPEPALRFMHHPIGLSENIGSVVYLTASELCFLTATELAGRIRRREASCEEVMRAHIDQIERVNPKVNAIVTFLPEQALDAARSADGALARGAALGPEAAPLYGLPVAHKDLAVTKGIRTTFGSPIYRDFVPAVDALIVERLKSAGAITVGKTNTPEFGAGSQTFNPVFGATLNPYDPTKTCGGSSGARWRSRAAWCRSPTAATWGLAAQSGQLLQRGGVSVRRPAACRSWPVFNAWYPLSVVGPMARTVGDLALQLSAMAGPDPRAPISIAEPGSLFGRPLARDFKGIRMA